MMAVPFNYYNVKRPVLSGPTITGTYSVKYGRMPFI
jgi:hypothetical protein